MTESELNILCVGELMAGKSTFLESYTGYESESQQYKIFMKQEKKIKKTVFLHEIEEREGMDAYFKYPFNALLFFVRIGDFHNSSKNLLQFLNSYSSLSGSNVYKVPVAVIVLSSKLDDCYNDISYSEKRAFEDEINSIVQLDQIIYVESDQSFQKRLSDFFLKISQERWSGVKDTLYTQWFFRGFSCFYLQQIPFHLTRLYQDFKNTYCTSFQRHIRKKIR